MEEPGTSVEPAERPRSDRRARTDRRKGDRRKSAARLRLWVTFTGVYLVVSALVFGWVYRFSTRSATEHLQQELAGCAPGAVEGVNAPEVIALYRDGKRNQAGFSDDPRYAHQLAWFHIVHRLSPQVWPYLFVRGAAADTRRFGKAAGADEFVYLVDLFADYDRDKAAHFLEPDVGSPYTLRAWEKGETVARPDLYRDKFGSWLSLYVPLKLDGKVVALLGLDFDAEYVRAVQTEVARQMSSTFLVVYALISLIGLYIYRVRSLRSLFGRYVSLSLLRDLALVELGYASRRRVTVLFTDINNFSTRCEQHNAEEIIDMLNRYFEAMNEIIVDSGGWIKQFVGDEIMVIYGAPDAHPRPEKAAVEAALKMIARLEQMDRDSTEPGFFEIKVGIHTGEVIVGNVGSRLRTEYAAVGDHVNLGSRIMNMSKALGARILISGSTYEIVKDLPGVQFSDRGVHPVKGRLSEVRIYEVN